MVFERYHVRSTDVISLDIESFCNLVVWRPSSAKSTQPVITDIKTRSING